MEQSPAADPTDESFPADGDRGSGDDAMMDGPAVAPKGKGPADPSATDQTGGVVADPSGGVETLDGVDNPDGSDSKSKAKTENLTVNGLKVMTVDVTGTYTAEMAPGSGTFHNDENYRLRAAVIETPKGNYFVKLAGPAKTIARWDQSYNDYLKSFEFK